MVVRDERHAKSATAADAIAPGAVTALVARLARPPTSEAPPPLLPGVRVGRYEVIREIGHGGFGAVYEAHDTALNRLVALKVFYPTGAADPAAAREGEAAARLAHPNIAALHDAGAVEGGFAYLIYEILHGETLESRLARGLIPPGEAVAIAVQVARALAHAHEHGVVHRDLKPSNVFLTAEGDVKVLDFGVALLFGRAAPAAGTPAYMAPEQRRGEPEDARTDLYALGVLLREMLNGDRDAATRAPSGNRVPASLQLLLTSLLAEDPTARPRSARAVVADVEAAARALAAPRVRRLRFAIAWLAGLALFVAFGAALLVRERLRPRGYAPDATLPSIAVMPFADMSPQRDQEYFSEGIAEEILDALVHVEGLRVAGRSSSFAYKHRIENAADIGRALHVSAVLEGSVRKAGQRVRIAATLVGTSDGFYLWSQSYDRDLTDVFAVQDEIAHAVVAALEVKLLPGRTVGVREHLATHPEAYSHYLLARQLFHLGSPESYRRAVESYEKALAIDPKYAPAWAGLAVAANYASSYALSVEEFQNLIRRSREAGPRAIEFDPELAEGFAARGYGRAVLEHDWAGAQADMKRAIALSPRDAEIRRLYGFVLGPQGRTVEAIESARIATELDPGAPLCWNSLGNYLLDAGQYARARTAFREALRLNPDQSFAAGNLVSALVLDGDAPGALPVAASILSPADRLKSLAIVHHSLGHVHESRKALDALIAQYRDRAPYVIAEVQAWRGESEQAFFWLERAAALSDRDLIGLKVNPMLRGLRGDPRFAALLRRMNLPTD